jgi:hypothetical protein
MLLARFSLSTSCTIAAGTTAPAGKEEPTRAHMTNSTRGVSETNQIIINSCLSIIWDSYQTSPIIGTKRQSLVTNMTLFKRQTHETDTNRVY